jgi:hypothetical protein
MSRQGRDRRESMNEALLAAPVDRVPDPPRVGTAEAEPLDLPQGIQARPALDWLHEAETPQAWPAGPDAVQPPAPETPEPPAKSRIPAPVLMAGLVLAGLGFGYGLLSPTPEPRSAALEIERAASMAPVPAPETEIGGAEPLPQDQAQDSPGAVPGDAAPEPEATSAAAPSLDPAPPAPVAEDAAAASAQDTAPVAPPASPGPAAVPSTPAPATSIPPPAPVPAAGTAGGESLTHIAKLLETHQALIERLERREQVLSDRIEGLEVRAESAREKPASPAAPKTPRLPPETTSRPVKTLQRRAPPQGAPLPFSVESVDTWNGEKTVVVRDGGRLIDLKPGDSHAGWRIETADGQTVTVRSPHGAAHTVEAGAGS